jgi:hypothetical protein
MEVTEEPVAAAAMVEMAGAVVGVEPRTATVLPTVGVEMVSWAAEAADGTTTAATVAVADVGTNRRIYSPLCRALSPIHFVLPTHCHNIPVHIPIYTRSL